MEKLDAATVIVTAVPALVDAESIRDALLQDRLAACVQIHPPCKSTYRWQGDIESADEITVVAKTVSSRAEAAMEAIERAHPYSTPEILATVADRCSPGYLAWLNQECRPRG